MAFSKTFFDYKESKLSIVQKIRKKKIFDNKSQYRIVGVGLFSNLENKSDKLIGGFAILGSFSTSQVGAQRQKFRPKDRLNVIEDTLERLSQDVKIITQHQNHVKNIKLEVSTSNLEGCVEEIPLSIDLALPNTKQKDSTKRSNNKALSSKKSNIYANSNELHYDRRCKNSPMSDNLMKTSKGMKYASTMAYKYLRAHQEKEEPLSVEKLCSIGHNLFVMQDWKGAMEMYSRCIPTLKQKIESNEKEGSSLTKQQEDLLFAYSNRAETYLRLRNYEDAMIDATKALELNAKHWISLVRKGKALDGLELYEQSISCYMSALNEEPQDEKTRKALIQSKVSYEQAYKGIYDLTKFIISGSEGDLPLCCDFVGPVEICKSRLGGRGLFATRDLAVGELVLVSSALLVAPKESMARELWSLVSSSKQRMQQICTLSSNLNKDVDEDMEIPPMDLFTPGSYHNLQQLLYPYHTQNTLANEGLYQGQDTIDQHINLESIEKIVEVNAVNVMDVIACAEPGNGHESSNAINYSGLWLLPSLINHSCTPNCVTSTPAGIAFVRVSRQVRRGEELNIAYFDVMKSVEVRKQRSQECHFECKCPRCTWEWSYPKELQSVREKLLILANKAILDCMKCANAISRLRVLPQLASLILSFETIIQSEYLESEYQNWVRASVMDTYLAASRVLMSARMYVEDANRIQMLKLLVEAIQAGGGGDGEVMGIGVMLLDQVEWHHGRESNEYCKTEAIVRNVFKIFHGNLTRDVYVAVVSSYSKLLNRVNDKELIEDMGDLYEALVQLQDTLANSLCQFKHLQSGACPTQSQETHQVENYENNHEELILEFLSKIEM